MANAEKLICWDSQDIFAIKDLFIYPIERYIPPVAKVDDVAEATVEAELREYVARRLRLSSWLPFVAG